jgi:hypothetical protein
MFESPSLEAHGRARRGEFDLTVLNADRERHNLGAAYLRATMRGMDVKEAGRLGALATNSKLSKKKRRENARKAARARWAK